ncbi:DsbE family thiol:disulfide interchange protein [Kangiella sediminilitoris]|uniref:Thiol:disulfide interchange protein n=1 Tax=Kangiella sediminilitoris TaxID=1144748 RepID=A0A1B3B9U2_9GAMM|nr:DsbE family thiol:disulfide interchange protein [Kangiella sediminilitoris]AOE49571.1 thiol:disulfide interchange protein [Kangiella sediminilitoris]
MNKKALMAVGPIIVFLVLIVFFWVALKNDPKKLNSNLIDKQVPAFELPALQNPEQLFTEESLPKELFLMNIWGSWCGPCHIEHPYLMKYSGKYEIPIVGVNYKDETIDGLTFIKEKGNPYHMIIADQQGTLGIDLGVYGAPETFIVDKNGTIRFRYVGVIDDRVWSTKLLPIMEQIKGSEIKPVTVESKGQ